MPTKRQYDSNRMRRVYPLVRNIPNFEGLTSSGGANLEVSVINFNNSSSETYSFTEQYISAPICIITPEDENINVYITNLSTTSVTIESSSSFTGKVHIQIHEVENA